MPMIAEYINIYIIIKYRRKSYMFLLMGYNTTISVYMSLHVYIPTIDELL